MRLPALIIASAGNGYQTLYKSKAFDSLNPADFAAVCKRMDSFKFEGDCSYFITQSLGKMVIGKSTAISRAEFGNRKIKVTHCYFMNMNSFIDIVRGFRRQGAVIATFREQVRQDYDTNVENITFVKRSFAEKELTVKDIRDAVISFGLAEGKRKYMFSDIDSINGLKVLLEYFPANFLSDLSILSEGESDTNDMNILFGTYNVISDNRVISVHAAAKSIANISDEIEMFVTSNFKNAIVEIMEHVDRYERGYLTELVSTTKIVTEFEQSAIVNAGSIMKLMDKSSTIEGKMAIYGIVLEIKNKIQNSQIVNTDVLEKYWAFVLYTSVVGGDKKNAALVHNICANHKIINRENYIRYVKQAIEMKYREISDEDLAMLILISHEKEQDKTRLLNTAYDARMAKAFINNRLDLNRERLSNIEDILMEMIYA